MPEPILLALALLAAGVAVLWPLWRAAPTGGSAADERTPAELRHRVALESLRDVEADRRAGSLDDAAYAAAAGRGGGARRRDPRRARRRCRPRRRPARRRAPARACRWPSPPSSALALVGGSLLPAAGIANRTEINEGLAAAQAAEAARQHRIEELTEAFAADPEDAAVLSDLADAYLAGSSDADLAAAAAALQLLIAVEPDRADAYERIVTAYIRADDFGNARAALDSYEGIATADPVEVAFLDGLIALRGEGDEDRAAAAFDRFLELAPDDPRADDDPLPPRRGRAPRVARSGLVVEAGEDALHRGELIGREAIQEVLRHAAQVGGGGLAQALVAGIGQGRPLAAPIVVARHVARSGPAATSRSTRRVAPERERSSRSASSLIRSRCSPAFASWTRTS